MMSYKNVGMEATRMKGLIGAWVGKGYEVQHKFMLMGTMDTQAQNVVSLLQKTIQDTESNVHKSARNAWIMVGGIFVAIAVVYLTVYFLSK
jgi:hypothetical protein